MKKESHSQNLTLEQALSKAKKAAKQGNSTLASQLYEAILQHQPNHPVAKKGLRKLQKMGLSQDQAAELKTANPPQDQINSLITLFQSGQLQQSEKNCRELLQAYPRSFALINLLAVVLQSQGKLEDAVENYNRAIQLKPDSAEAFTNRGNALKSMGRLQEAVTSYDNAIKLNPDLAEAYSNRGNALSMLGQLEGAVESYDKAIQLKSDYAEAYSNKGNALMELGQLVDALTSTEKALQLKPDYPEAYYNRGTAQKDLGRMNEAIQSFDKAIQFKPDYAEAYNNRGIALYELKRFDEAMRSYETAIQLNPNFGEAYSNRGKLLKDLGQLEKAVENYDKAILLNPAYAEAFYNRGNAFMELGRLQEALANHEKAIQLNPGYTKAYSNLLMALNYTSSSSEADRLAMAHRFGKFATGKTQYQFSTHACSAKPGRLRVGFVSGDLRNHPVGYFLESILSEIDSSKIELIAYPTSDEADDLSERVKPFFSHWQPVIDLNDEELAKLIHADGIHILLDLSGHTANNRLPVFAYKPAPVQVSWLGYFATTGINEMDYFLGDPYVTPAENDEQFTEKIWRLPQTRWCFTPPDVDTEVSVAPVKNNGYITFGCFNNLSKMEDRVVLVWARILDSVPHSQLLLKTKQLRDPLLRESVVQRFSAHGISSKRIILEGPEDRQSYFAAYNRIDIALDPFPFTGGTTSIEGLWMGVPLLSLAGDSLISRQGVGILMNAGLPDWIAKNEEDYLAKAIFFASDTDKLASLRAGLRKQVLTSPLFDAPCFARNFENALLQMWNQKARQ